MAAQMLVNKLPQEWSFSRLGDICAVKNGYAFKSEDYVNDGVLNFRVVNIGSDGGLDITSDVEYLPDNFKDKYQDYLLNEGDILLVMVGATRGKLAYVTRDVLPALMNQNMWRVVPTVSGVDSRYVYFFLRGHIALFMKKYPEDARGFFKKEDFRDVSVPLPSPDERRNIVHMLSVIQSAIDTQKKIVQVTTELKKALMQKLFTEGLRGESQKKTEIGRVPKSWTTKRIGDFCDIRSSSILFSKISKIKTAEERAIRVLALKVSDMNLEGNEDQIKKAQIEFYLDKSSKHIKYIIPPFALLFPKRGAAIATNKKRLTLCHSILDPNLMALIPDHTCSPYYLYHYFQRFDLRTIIDKGLIPQLNKKNLIPLLVPLPEMDEQNQIVGSIKGVDDRRIVAVKKLKLFEKFFKAILCQLMTGQIRVKDLSL